MNPLTTSQIDQLSEDEVTQYIDNCRHASIHNSAQEKKLEDSFLYATAHLTRLLRRDLS